MPEDDHSEVLKAHRLSTFRRCKLQKLKAQKMMNLCTDL
ncbi:hypothetical protein L195_g013755 [Trifolium pratense]|uniref:Uncharacterized protein n=1 Tax=Trifolium pratense TaxID=57577 RepID=A0A2K3PP04_TRIPR|nr:hypothetical protein L195_g013755 [Trifolium pratense]